MLGEGTADVVVTTEMLEHADAWRAAVTGIVQVLAPGGVLLLTTRGPGFPYHPHPQDHYRFTVEQMGAIAKACGLDIIRCEPDPDPNSPAVFLLAAKPGTGGTARGWPRAWPSSNPGRRADAVRGMPASSRARASVISAPSSSHR